MKSFYLKFRIALITLAIGLASVWFFKGMAEGFFDVLIELPKVRSEDVLVVFPRTKKQMPFAGGSGGGKGTLSGNESVPFIPKSISQISNDKNKRQIH